ncbi:MAG TPA: phosphatase domain-containing protein [Novosphingobium sp.]|nr:phosphatase domain-containing protein [Novosphingobium sp.]
MILFGGPARVRPFFGYRNEAALVLDARALRMREPSWERRTTLAKMAALLRQFASDEVSALAVTLEVRIDGRAPLTQTRRSDREGYLRFELGFEPVWPLPAEPAWETVRLSWVSRDGPQSVEGYVLAPGRDGRLAVISDIDDTIVETGAGDLARNWRRVAAQMPGERVAVPGAVAFYGALGGGNVGDTTPATRRPFFYVSSSPWNLFDYLVAFQKAHGLPQGPLLLRDWGLNRATLGHDSHRAHKVAAIGSLAAFYPGMRFALIGDDTQADALAFAETVATHPGRIAAVFVRRAPGAEIDAFEQAALDAIAAAGVELWSGESWDVGADFLAALGFTPGGETAQIVEAIDQAKETPL